MKASASGKIILSGEYAVLFGYSGIAIPAPLKVTATFDEDQSQNNVRLEFRDMSLKSQVSSLKSDWGQYLKTIIHLCGDFRGTLTIENTIPLGKGMGSSTALIIAICKCLLGEDCKEKAQEIENTLNPGNSGIDFAVIWNEQPIRYTRGCNPEYIDLPQNLMSSFLLIDTGMPEQQTPELVAWITERKNDLRTALHTIGNCTERLLAGEDLKAVIRDHHTAQVELGVVTDKAKYLITKIEQEGGAAKVIGAGSRTGGCGMVLVFGIEYPRVEELTSRILVS